MKTNASELVAKLQRAIDKAEDAAEEAGSAASDAEDAAEDARELMRRLSGDDKDHAAAPGGWSEADVKATLEVLDAVRDALGVGWEATPEALSLRLLSQPLTARGPA